MTYPFVYRWRKYRPELCGQRCRVLARGKMNSALVEFESGVKHVVSRNALRRVKS
jgi:hypothetical protein